MCDTEGFAVLPKVRSLDCHGVPSCLSLHAHWQFRHLAVVHTQEGESERAPVWTPEFQAPGWEGKLTHWSDWYALGVSIDVLLVRFHFAVPLSHTMSVTREVRASS